MAAITEDYVSFEIAKLLREKGFNEPCFAYYDLFHDSTGVTLKLYKKFPRNPLNKQYLNVPTLQMAMKWLREVHNCPIEILWHWNADSQCSEWYFVHHMELKPLPQIQYYDTYEEACEDAIKYCVERLI